MAKEIDGRDITRLREASETTARAFNAMVREMKVLNTTLIGLAMILNDEHKEEVIIDGGEGTGPEAPTG